MLWPLVPCRAPPVCSLWAVGIVAVRDGRAAVLPDGGWSVPGLPDPDLGGGVQPGRRPGQRRRAGPDPHRHGHADRHL